MGLRKFSRFTIAIGKDADIGQTLTGARRSSNVWTSRARLINARRSTSSSASLTASLTTAAIWHPGSGRSIPIANRRGPPICPNRCVVPGPTDAIDAVVCP